MIRPPLHARMRAWLAQNDGVLWVIAVFGASVLLGGFAAYDQVHNRIGLEFLLGAQVRLHQRVLDGVAIDPWQYRPFSDYLIEALMSAGRALAIKVTYVDLFVSLRFMQNVAIFLTAAAYWRRVGVGRQMVLLSLTVLAWVFSFAGQGSALYLDTYFDVLFYLIAGLLILGGRYYGLIPLMVVAAVNRETSGLIPVMLVGAAVRTRPRLSIDRRPLLAAGVSMAVFLVEYGGLRLAYGPRDMYSVSGHLPGWGLLLYNLTPRQDDLYLIATLSILPLVALVRWKAWPVWLHRFFWAIVPAWLIIHVLAANVAESRLFLVPQTLLFIPAAFLTAQPELELREPRPGSRATGPPV